MIEKLQEALTTKKKVRVVMKWQDPIEGIVCRVNDGLADGEAHVYIECRDIPEGAEGWTVPIDEVTAVEDM